jgi:hypothetical protein
MAGKVDTKQRGTWINCVTARGDNPVAILTDGEIHFSGVQIISCAFTDSP